jgi:hypothetical protein
LVHVELAGARVITTGAGEANIAQGTRHEMREAWDRATKSGFGLRMGRPEGHEGLVG